MKRSRINNLSIQNFKAFGDMVDVPIRPITLIFGENSSGKSSILHSLLFLNQMQHQPQNQIADITYTKAGGNSVDLGGLPQLKYGQSEKQTMSFQLEHNIEDERALRNLDINLLFDTHSQLDFIQLSFNGMIECEVIIKDFTYLEESSTFEFNVEIDLDALIHILQNLEFRKWIFTYSVNNFLHFDCEEVDFENLIKELSPYKNQGNIVSSKLSDEYTSFSQDNIIRLLGEPCNFDLVSSHIISNKKINRSLYLKIHTMFESYFADKYNSAYKLKQILQMLYKIFWNAINKLGPALEIHYLGPIRAIPTRNFDTLDSISRDPSTGSMAWETLTTNEDARNQVNQWLTSFGTNKQITTEQLIDTAHLRKLINDSANIQQLKSAITQSTSRHMLRFYDPQKNIYLSHRDLGVGISQVLPVVVNCVTNKGSMVLIEQPELHLHPRLQGDLADLFIDTAIKGDQHNTYVIETHSEHIIRRVMRRIREDRNKSAGETRITKGDVAILYVAAGPNGSTVTHLRLDDEGDLIDEWPNGFFEESFRDDMAGR